MSRTGRNSGYTLLELIVALGIISLVAVSIPMLAEGYLPGVALNAAADQIKGDLALMRSEARREGITAGIQLGEDANAYILLPSGQVRKVRPDIALRLAPGPDDLMGDKDAPFSIVFFPQGGSTGGAIAITNGKRSKVLEIDWLTGAVGEETDG